MRAEAYSLGFNARSAWQRIAWVQRAERVAAYSLGFNARSAWQRIA